MKKPMKAAGPLIFAAAIAAAVLISVSGIRCYAVLTGSMEPVLPVGSLLVVVPMSFDELKVGQDITYKTAGGTVTHRIVAIDQAARTVTTQGLTNNVADTPVTAENIVGRVQLCLPWMGYPVKILNDTKRSFATVYKGNIIKNLIMDCQSYTKYRPNETTGGIFVSWRRKEELPTGA